MERFNTYQAAEIIGVCRRTLQRWRDSGTGPTYLKIGRSIRYEKKAIADFIDRSKKEAGVGAGDVSAVRGA